jgi:hypothetical protein
MARGPGVFWVNLRVTESIALRGVAESNSRLTEVEVTAVLKVALEGPKKAGIEEEVTTGPGVSVARAPVNKAEGARVMLTVSKTKTGSVMSNVKLALILCLFIMGLGKKLNVRSNAPVPVSVNVTVSEF